MNDPLIFISTVYFPASLGVKDILTESSPEGLAGSSAWGSVVFEESWNILTDKLSEACNLYSVPLRHLNWGREHINKITPQNSN